MRNYLGAEQHCSSRKGQAGENISQLLKGMMMWTVTKDPSNRNPKDGPLVRLVLGRSHSANKLMI